MTRNALEFDALSIVFGTSPAAALLLMDAGENRAEIEAETGQILGVHDCTLALKEGEILVLMGLSGSGKSTLLRAANGLNPVIRGEARIRHKGAMTSVSRASKAALRAIRQETVSMVFQNFALLPWRSVAQNIALGLEFSGLAREEIIARVQAQLELVGLNGWGERKVSELSGGMQQRVGLARAFATQAPILLMDEPFSALDPLIRTKMQDELLSLQIQLKRSILFVSHDLDEAFRIGSRIAIMEGGRLIQCGTAQEIITHPANAYVAEFVAHMNPLSLLKAADIMRAPTGAALTQSVPAEMLVKELLRHMRAAPGACFGVMADGTLLGEITASEIIAAIAPRSTPPAHS